MSNKNMFDIGYKEDKESNTFTVWLTHIPGLVVQVDKLEDAPKELATSLEVMVQFEIKKGVT